MKKMLVILIALITFGGSLPVYSHKTESKIPTTLQQERSIPAHSYIYISSKYALELIEIFDDQGNLYEKIPLQATTYYALDIRKWPLGVYTIKVTNNISTLKRKILKIR